MEVSHLQQNSRLHTKLVANLYVTQSHETSIIRAPSFFFFFLPFSSSKQLLMYESRVCFSLLWDYINGRLVMEILLVRATIQLWITASVAALLPVPRAEHLITLPPNSQTLHNTLSVSKYYQQGEQSWSKAFFFTLGVLNPNEYPLTQMQKVLGSGSRVHVCTPMSHDLASTWDTSEWFAAL